MPLTDTAVRNAKPRDKVHRLADCAGLYLQVSPAGGRLWRMNYRFQAKQRTLAFGAYPAVTLAEARARRDTARKLLDDGIDSGVQRKVEKLVASVSSADISAKSGWRSVRRKGRPRPPFPRTAGCRGDYAYPWLGSRPIGDIEAPELLAVLRSVEERGLLETARRLRSVSGRLFRYAIATGRAKRDPSADLRDALIPSPAE